MVVVEADVTVMVVANVVATVDIETLVVRVDPVNVMFETVNDEVADDAVSTAKVVVDVEMKAFTDGSILAILLR